MSKFSNRFNGNNFSASMFFMKHDIKTYVNSIYYDAPKQEEQYKLLTCNKCKKEFSVWADEAWMHEDESGGNICPTCAIPKEEVMDTDVLDKWEEEDRAYQMNDVANKENL